MCSRRRADVLIAEGAVRINGALVTLGTQVEEGDVVSVSGQVIEGDKPKQIVIAYNKPVGIITSVDPRAHDNVITHIGLREKIFPIGRLDVASSGLLLLTNDGELSERITHPRYYHEKEYVVTVDKSLRAADLQTMGHGMVILGSQTKPAKVVQESERTFRIILTEGRNRQIRRMCEGLGYEVRRLTRERVMNIRIGALKPGEWRYLTSKEVHALESSLSKK